MFGSRTTVKKVRNSLTWFSHGNLALENFRGVGPLGHQLGPSGVSPPKSCDFFNVFFKLWFSHLAHVGQRAVQLVKVSVKDVGCDDVIRGHLWLVDLSTSKTRSYVFLCVLAFLSYLWRYQCIHADAKPESQDTPCDDTFGGMWNWKSKLLRCHGARTHRPCRCTA